MTKLSIDDLDVKGKRVIMRVDFNVPLDDEGDITNDLRIRGALPSIQKLVKEGAKVILMSHLGRPKGKVVPKMSLKPVQARLSQLMGDKPIAFAADCTQAADDVAKLGEGDVLLLENLRFHPGEASKDANERAAMAEKLAAYADLFVSDAFGTAHRNAASMTGVPAVLGGGAAGCLMKKEISFFGMALNNPTRPLLAILGGAKVSDKLQLIRNMLDKVDSIAIGGAMAYTFLKAQGKGVGTSLCETEAEAKDGTKIDILALSLELLKEAEAKGVTMLLPIDHLTNGTFAGTESPHVTEGADIPDGQMALDIGPRTLAVYKEEIVKSKTVIWNGPQGVFELEGFKAGTFGIAETLAAHSEDITSIVGGGDTASAAEASGHAAKLSHISTGGGASLELLEGKVLPGLAALTDKE